MIEEAEGRRAHLLDHVAELDAGIEPRTHEHPAASSPSRRTRSVR
jgi:hypothetical protein